MPKRKRSDRDYPKLRRTYLRDYREARGLSLEQLCEDIDEIYGISVSYASMGRIERGVQPYNQRLLEVLAEFYAVPVAALISRPPGRPALDEMVIGQPDLRDEAEDFIQTRQKRLQ